MLFYIVLPAVFSEPIGGSDGVREIAESWPLLLSSRTATIGRLAAPRLGR